jgi:hypothetical protein
VKSQLPNIRLFFVKYLLFILFSLVIHLYFYYSLIYVLMHSFRNLFAVYNINIYIYITLIICV